MHGFAGGSGTGASWQAALDTALTGIEAGGRADIAFLFAHSAFAPHYAELVAAAWERIDPRHLIGCSGQGVIATSREIEREPAISVMTISCPNAELTPLRLEDARPSLPGGLAPMTAWLVFADPFSVDGEWLLERFAAASPAPPVIGGMASSLHGPAETAVFLDGAVYEDGTVALGLGDGVAILPIVSQGCMPIGQPWIVTGARENLIETIAGRPAVEVLTQTLRELDEETRARAQSNLLLGLAMDEYRDQHGIGDFLVRNLLGYEPKTGAIAVSALPRVGQTVQFQLRDARAATEHLRLQLEAAGARLGGSRPGAALLCSCNGRGAQLFGPIDHDPVAIARELGDVPVAGLFCNGEFGPVGTHNYLHGFTATIALFTRPGEKPA
ncbi:MAG TPA: FIST N-terminal domain-containing protein [Dehalococcoidia bacterium]|nr:FIST N-terminal domain-containing protein [Dehalococcoidia bacterium]